MKVALTGITGFVGQNLMPILLRECPDVNFLTLNIDMDDALAKYPYSEYKNFKHVMVDQLDELKKFNPDIVLHLATITSPSNDTSNIHPMISTNIEFGVLMLDVLKDCKNLKLFVNTGSFAEFMNGPQEYESAYLYAATKTAFRSFLNYYSHLAGFKYVTAIPYSIYGGKMTVKRLMDYIKESMDSNEPVCMSAGEQVLDFIHVNDVAGFYTYVITHADEFYKLYNTENFYIGTGRGTNIRELAAMMERKYGKHCNIAWGQRPYRDRDTMHAVAPVEKNYSKIGWKADISLYEGI